MFDGLGEKSPKKYSCEICDYTAANLSNYNKHILTRKHQNLTRLDNISPKKYSCELCDYTTCNKKDYNKHFLTRKHQKLTECIQKSLKKYSCDICTKKCNTRQGLWSHIKVCTVKNNNNVPITTPPVNTVVSITEKVSIIQQNQEFKNMILEQQDKILTLTQNCSITNHITNTNNTLNNQFNINMFLNETCKDALNINDFMDTLQLNFENLEYVGTNGYVNGITKIIMDGLDKLDIYKRPIHCTDKKRETLYIKDNDVWEKDTENKDKIRRFVGKVAKNNLNMVSQWQHSYPGIDVLDSPAYNLYMKIMRESINCGGRQEQADKNDSRIIKNLINRVYVDKHIEKNPSIL